MIHTSTVIFWGAGATASLGMRVTEAQGQFIASLSGASGGSTLLAERVRLALAGSADSRWCAVLTDLITILSDTDAADTGIHIIEQKHLDAMARHWRLGAPEDVLRRRIMELRLTYDWPALRDVIRICPGSYSNKVNINDLFNVLDMHIALGHGFRVQDGRFLDIRRLLAAKAALKMLLHAMFYIDYQICLEDSANKLRLYYDFARTLGTQIQRDGATTFADFDRPDFIRSKVAFVSLNYDPIGIWIQWIANRDLNIDSAVPLVGNSAAKMQIFHDMGHFIPSRRINPSKRPALWYPMNEACAQRLNEDCSGTNQRIRLSKFLFPHGCLCWRECPDCGKLSAYHGDEWDLYSTSLIPPPPLKGFERRASYPDIKQLTNTDRAARLIEKRCWEDGMVDARACLHCGTLTSTQHTQTVMQSSFKHTPPSFIDEIQRDLRALVMHANHIIFMGYSLPHDDVSYRSFFAARRQRITNQPGKPPVHCTIVGWDTRRPGWTRPSELQPGQFPSGPVNSALEIFGVGNVRFYGGGVPNVFLDRAQNVSQEKLDVLLTWPESERAPDQQN